MSGSVYLLDTNVLLALIRGRELGRYIDGYFGLRHGRQRPLVCIVSHGEIWVLARRCNWGADRREALQIMLASLVPVQLDHPGVIDAYVHLDLCSHGHSQGARNMGKNDLWIAAAAHASGATLLTTDQDFAHLIPSEMEGVIIDPRDRRPVTT
jgi:tRNA(fMet)-specific endonuclease VapC